MTIESLFVTSMEIIDSNIFLAGNTITENTIVERNPRTALDLAQDQGIQGFELWTDLREQITKNINERIFDSNLAKSELLKYWYDAAFNKIENKIPEQIYDAIDDIHYDLFCIALNSSLGGNKEVFFSQIEEIYKQGGWPCGWKGTYPQGEIIVFLPK